MHVLVFYFYKLYYVFTTIKVNSDRNSQVYMWPDSHYHRSTWECEKVNEMKKGVFEVMIN